MKGYPEYKDSGVEWIGEIPAHWTVKRLKYVARVQPSNVDKKSLPDETNVLLCNYMDVYKNEYIDGRLPFMEATANSDEIRKFTLRQGDVLVTKDSETPDDIANAACVAEDLPGVLCGYHLTHITPQNDELIGSYLFRLFQADKYKAQFEVAANGVTRFGLPVAAFTDAFVPLPSPAEQQTIAKYLDRKTADIDTFIAKKRQLIALLKEERTALINNAVTKGIHPGVEMKDSGIEWLGEIPKHWEVKKLKYLIKDLESGTSVNAVDTPSVNGEIGILKTSCVYTNTFQPEENKQVLPEEINRVQCPVRGNSIIISRMNTPDLVGASGYVDKDYPYLFLPDRLWQTVFFTNDALNVKWLSHLMVSYSFRKLLSSLATGTSPSMKNISKDDILTIEIPLPQKSEQAEIARFIVEKQNNIDATISKVENEITLLQEYRTALISEVVTGKVDVRGYQIETNPLSKATTEVMAHAAK